MSYSNRISLFILLTFISCRPGYQKEGDNWTWVSYDEGAGKRITKIDSVDNESFRILPNKEYAKDKNQVYLNGSPILSADPNHIPNING